jgi:hypothetical protein
MGLDREPSVEKVFYADRANVLTKEAAFRQIQRQLGLPAGQMLIVGDRPSREIRAGKQLGMRTVRVHRGEFKSQMPASPEEAPDHVIQNISQLKKLPFAWGAETKTAETKTAQTQTAGTKTAGTKKAGARKNGPSRPR